MTRHGHERPIELKSHVLEETRLAASGGTFQHHRQPPLVSRLEYRDFVGLRLVIRRNVADLRRLHDVALDAP
jgi:hypothetical protein